MNMYLNNAQLKDNAKEKLTGKYTFLIGVYLVVQLITSQVSSLIISQIPTATTAGLILAEAISYIVSVFAGLLSVGIIYIFMKINCNVQVYLSDVFYAFTHNTKTFLLLSLVIQGISFLFYLSYGIPLMLPSRTGDWSMVLWAIPGILVAAIILLPVSLALSQCYFLALDFPDKSAKEILQLSMRIMKGHKVRLFLIQLSFIPLSILAILSIIGNLWLNPYKDMVYTQFYFDIMKPVQKD